jgi:hypothetical protein
MTKAAYRLLLVIIGLLAVNLLFDRVIPAVVAASNKRDYAQLAANCEIARASEQEVRVNRSRAQR